MQSTEFGHCKDIAVVCEYYFMILIVGLGNIGPQYIFTPHNIGFLVVDELTDGQWQLQDKCHAYIHKSLIEGEEVILAKPTTMMNLSGQAVSRLAQYYKISPEDIWIVHDELDLPLGRMKVATSVGNNGHNGLISIQGQLGHNRFWRFRVGIDLRDGRDIPGRSYVLKEFARSDEELVMTAVDQAVDALRLSLREEPKAAMQVYNRVAAQGENPAREGLTD